MLKQRSRNKRWSEVFQWSQWTSKKRRRRRTVGGIIKGGYWWGSRGERGRKFCGKWISFYHFPHWMLYLKSLFRSHLTYQTSPNIEGPLDTFSGLLPIFFTHSLYDLIQAPGFKHHLRVLIISPDRSILQTCSSQNDTWHFTMGIS